MLTDGRMETEQIYKVITDDLRKHSIGILGLSSDINIYFEYAIEPNLYAIDDIVIVFINCAKKRVFVQKKYIHRVVYPPLIGIRAASAGLKSVIWAVPARS